MKRDINYWMFWGIIGLLGLITFMVFYLACTVKPPESVDVRTYFNRDSIECWSGKVHWVHTCPKIIDTLVVIQTTERRKRLTDPHHISAKCWTVEPMILFENGKRRDTIEEHKIEYY